MRVFTGQPSGLLSSRWVPALVLAISLAATLLATYYLAITAEMKDRVRFENAIQQTTDAISQRMQVYESALRGGAALFAVHEGITRNEFRKYVERLRLTHEFRGIQGFGFTKRVPDREKEAFHSAMQEQFEMDFQITPPGDRPEYFPVTYLEPEDARNRAALGFDMFSETVRQHAMKTARDTGRRAVSGKVTLMQEIAGDQQAGFLIYLPVFRGGTIPPTIEERREKLIGFSYAPFRADDLFAGIFGDDRLPPVHFEVYDGVVTSPDHRLHASAAMPSENPQFSTTVVFEIPGHRWTLLLQSTVRFERQSSQFLAPWILLSGLLVSVTLFAITRALTHARSRAEAARKKAAEQREEYKVTLSSIGDAVIATDLDERITFMNPMAEDLTKWALAEALGKPLGDVFRTVHEFTGEPLPTPTHRVLTENRSIARPDHAILLGRKGGTRPIEDSAAPIRDVNGRLRGVVLVFQDVSVKRATELRRRRAEKELRDVQSRLKSGIQAASVGTWIWEIEENRVFADDYIAHIFLVSPKQAAGGPVEEYLKAVHPDDIERLKADIGKALASDGLHETEYRIPQRDGTVRWFTARGRIERDERGHGSRLVGAVIDVTERKRTEEALAETKAELEGYARNLEATVAERTARLRESVAELEAFSYSLSHDLRAPLRAIQGFSDILLEENRDRIKPEGIEYLAKITSSVSRVDRLIQDVLAFSKVSRQEITVEEVDAEKLLRRIISEQPELQPPQAEITIESPLLPILGHDASLTQCLTNLLDNAVKFVAPGTQPRVRIWSECRDGMVRLWVEDNGIGMKKEAQQKLFEMFQRIHRGTYPGVGLGLAIVRKAVERMGGQAGVESELGQGSRFWLQLPAVEAPAQAGEHGAGRVNAATPAG